jgi:hypothetical protein
MINREVKGMVFLYHRNCTRSAENAALVKPRARALISAPRSRKLLDVTAARR